MLAAFPSPNLSSLSVAGSILPVFAGPVAQFEQKQHKRLSFFYAVNAK
jgi:hypothetical protein